MKLRINENYYDNQTIAKILWDIENSGDERKIDKAYSYIDKWCDNPEEVCPDGYYDFTNASWGISEENIIEYLTNILNESVNITKRKINEKETPNIEVKNKGILEVPEGKNVDDLPLSHFVNLANKKGLSKITKALNNLQVWNKNDDPKLSKWAGDMIDKLNKKLKKEESLTIKEDNNKSYWKYYQNDKAIERIENSDRYFDERSIRQVKLYPCKTEDDCYAEEYSCAVRNYEFPHNPIFGTKDEAYKELMYYLNNTMYEKDNDL